MSQIIPTLEVVHPDVEGATMIINESDYDPAVHVKTEDDARRPAEAKAKTKAGTGQANQTAAG